MDLARQSGRLKAKKLHFQPPGTPRLCTSSRLRFRYENVVELYNGKADCVGKDAPRVNPSALERTESNIKVLYSFVKLLLTNGGAKRQPEDDDVIYKALKGMYLLDAANCRLSNLFRPKISTGICRSGSAKGAARQRADMQ